SCYRRMPLPADDGRNSMLSRVIDRAAERQGFGLAGFVFMPEHVHLVVFPRRANARIAPLLYAIKRPFSFQVKQALQAAGSPLLEQLSIRERPSKRAFRFWQEGAGYDRNLITLETVLAALEYLHQNPVKRGLCSSPEE